MSAESKFEVYTGDYAPGLGVPVVVVTGYPRTEGVVRSEYFAFFSDDPSYFDSHAFNTPSGPAAESPIPLDVESMRNFARDSAEGAIQNHLYNLYLRDRDKGYLDRPAKLQPAGNRVLSTIHLRGENGKALMTMRNQTMSEELRNYLDALFTLRVTRHKLGADERT